TMIRNAPSQRMGTPRSTDAARGSGSERSGGTTVSPSKRLARGPLISPPTQPSPTRGEGFADNSLPPCGGGLPSDPLPPCGGGPGGGASVANPAPPHVPTTTLQGADTGSSKGTATSGGVTSLSRTRSQRLWIKAGARPARVRASGAGTTARPA